MGQILRGLARLGAQVARAKDVVDLPRNQERLELCWQVGGAMWDVQVANAKNQDHCPVRLFNWCVKLYDVDAAGLSWFAVRQQQAKVTRAAACDILMLRWVLVPPSSALARLSKQEPRRTPLAGLLTPGGFS